MVAAIQNDVVCQPEKEEEEEEAQQQEEEDMAECAGNNEPLVDSEAEPLKLSDLLDRGWKIFEEVDSTNEPLSSNGVQVKVKMGMSLLEKASGMVARLDLFSRNEELEEIATADLKYLLLPALLGALTMKQAGRVRRLEIVQTARACFMDFLRRCKDYNLSEFELPKSTNENRPDETSEHVPTNTVSVFSKDYTRINYKMWYGQL